MNPNNQGPVGPERPFTQKFLDTKFSFSWDRTHLICIVNALRPLQLPIGDLRSKYLRDVLEELERTAFNGITEQDYVPDPNQPAPEAPTVQTN